MAENRYATAQDVLADAQDLVVLRKVGEDRHVYAVKPSLEAQRQLYAESVADASERNIPAFQGHWQYDAKQGITGSSPRLGLRFDQRVLRPRGLWIPGLLEAKALEAKRKLENGVYRDYGEIVYTNDNPNKEDAKRLVAQAQELGLELPLIVPFRALEYTHGKTASGILVSFVQKPQGVISGQKAVAELDKLNFRGNSGVFVLNRGAGGEWHTLLADLEVSDDYGLVDWFCGESARMKFKRSS